MARYKCGDDGACIGYDVTAQLMEWPVNIQVVLSQPRLILPGGGDVIPRGLSITKLNLSLHRSRRCRLCTLTFPVINVELLHLVCACCVCV